MNKHPTGKPSVPQVPIRVRVLREIPVLPELQPVVGKVYDAIRGARPQSQCRRNPGEFCVIKVNGKAVILRRRLTEEPEYEEVNE